MFLRKEKRIHAEETDRFYLQVLFILLDDLISLNKQNPDAKANFLYL